MYCTTCYRVNGNFYITAFLANWLIAGRGKHTSVNYYLKSGAESALGKVQVKQSRTVAGIIKNFYTLQEL